jgi:hypothetical protein
MPLTPHERAALTALEHELRADDPALAEALAARARPPARSGPRPPGWLRTELASQWRDSSPAIRAFFRLLPVGLVVCLVGAAVGSPWVTMLGALVFLAASGCTVHESRVMRSGRRARRTTGRDAPCG